MITPEDVQKLVDDTEHVRTEFLKARYKEVVDFITTLHELPKYFDKHRRVGRKADPERPGSTSPTRPNIP